MFETLGSFSIFFFTVASFLLLGIIFEEKLLHLEDKFDAWYLPRKKAFKRKIKKTLKVLKIASKKATRTFVRELKKS